MSQEFTGRKAMGAIGSPVVLVTASHGDRDNVTAVNMIAGISFNPPMVCISLSHYSLTHTFVDFSGEFAINIVSPEQLELVKKVGSTTGRKMDKFKEFNIETIPGELVSCPLLKEAHTVLECRVDISLDIGKHSLYNGRVIAYHGIKEANPLYLYHGRYYSLGSMLGSF